MVAQGASLALPYLDRKLLLTSAFLFARLLSSTFLYAGSDHSSNSQPLPYTSLGQRKLGSTTHLCALMPDSVYSLETFPTGASCALAASKFASMQGYHDCNIVHARNWNVVDHLPDCGFCSELRMHISAQVLHFDYCLSCYCVLATKLV